MIDIWLYTWPDLYTRLVAYARLHILTFVVFFLSWCQLYIVHNFVLYISYLVIFYFSSHVVIAYIAFHARAFLFTHTLIRSLLTTLNSHVQGIGHLLILFRCSCDSTVREEIGVSPFLILVFLPFFLFMFLYFSWFMNIRFSLYSNSFYMISCVNAYMWYCSDRWFIIVYIYSLFRLLLGLACIHGVFPRVYTSPTLVASPLQRILGSGAWHFLSIFFEDYHC